MDKTSKKIMKYLKELPEPKYLFYSSDPHEIFDIDEDEFFRCVRYLASSGYIEFISNQNGIYLGVTPSHRAIHSKSIKFDTFKNWFFSTFLGGVITGVVSTLATEALLYLGAKLIGLL